MLIQYTRRTQGFTLIEMAVVLVIIGLLVGSFITSFGKRIEATQIEDTVSELEDIKSVLLAFAFTQSPARLPCPDTDVPPDGIEDCPSGAAVGVLPWQTLGIGYGDAWSNRYRYWASSNYTTAFNLNTVSNGAPGNNLALIRTRANDVTQDMADSAVAVVFSHGHNGLGATSTGNMSRPSLPAPGNDHDDEIENVNANRIFMSRPPTDEGGASVGGFFDDLLIWINAYELKAKMVETGKLP